MTESRTVCCWRKEKEHRTCSRLQRRLLGEGDTGAEFLRCDWEMREEKKTGPGIPVRKPVLCMFGRTKRLGRGQIKET